MSTRSFLAAILAFWGLAGFSQSFPNSLTGNHQLIAGTNISIIPPDSFVLSSNFKGFQNPNDPTSMIMVMEIPGPYSEVSKGFNGEMLESRGIDLRSKTDIEIAGYQGVLLELGQVANGMEFSKHILVYGDEEASTLVNGVFLKNDTELGQSIKAAMLSTYIDTALIADPRAALSYTVDETLGGLQFHSVIGNGMLFNRDLKTPTESEDQATLVADKSFAKIPIEDARSFCLTRLQQYGDPFSQNEEYGLQEIAVDGLNGFELLAQNDDNDEEALYQVILFEEEGGYYLFMGTYLTGKEEALEDIKKVIMSFERR